MRSSVDKAAVKMSRRWKLICVPTVIVTVIICFTSTYLLLVKGTNRWGSGRGLRVNQNTRRTGVETTRNFSRIGNREEKTRENITKVVDREQNKILMTNSAAVAVCCTDLMNLDKDKAVIIGRRRKNKGFLTIGIPNTPRSFGKSDLKRTLKSLIQNTPNDLGQSHVSIVVFASALDQSTRLSTRDIVAGFPEHVQSGLLQLIEAPRSFYPNLSALTGSDLYNRVKQNVDNAFLLAYAMDSADFYLQLSDNVRAPSNYLQSIRDFIKQQGGAYWVTLEFYPVGFTGKLFHGGGRDMQQLIHLFTEYAREQSVESLFGHFKDLNVQLRDAVRRPPLFAS
ncbi:alpha-1,3-mannosyl-glycoprotein 4-beta-N-acetylglucosaminyltransferase C-like isoform X2 [Acanthaster planci]|uniref:Alpha-1,3-mannosyl-glycoprotein 4-beta-N-acetylglucosaminyltransferase C-like isoform X2 n=1 Tax=Acanthaster planci TaxID=133434 RepID=A0A8B7ZB02_ACAPL|nr:alpha-1,3-mannosyl-glycoprotein 4-beta-N-acetylglucosaminyltransferase C-like isoform X2 [Acanthaster planci]XP_022102854.1 alpha-1,3-mannosyl-glycoprotein 4-beta-N-acetylglucosaminyltransferase C-like isoform X2 [Acanthaster planci]